MDGTRRRPYDASGVSRGVCVCLGWGTAGGGSDHCGDVAVCSVVVGSGGVGRDMLRVVFLREQAETEGS